MKVLLVGAYPPPYGGIAVQIQHLTRALPRAGVACRVLDIGGGRGAPSAGYESVTGPVDFVAKLIRYARSGYMLHLFTNGENWKSWIVALVVSVVGTLARAHAIVTITSGGAPSYLGRARAPLRALARLAVKLPAALVCRTEAIAQALAPWRGSAPLVLPAFSLSRLHPAKRLPEAVASFAARHRPLVASVVIFRWEYDVPTLLAAFRDVRKTHPSAGLVIVGAGEDEGKLRELVRLWNLGDSILLAGWVPYDECLAILGEADVFARTTLYDGDASSVREALALGVPVVASRTDFRPDGVVVFPPGDAEALRVALVETLAAEKQPPAARAPLSPASDEALVGLYRRVAADGAEAV